MLTFTKWCAIIKVIIITIFKEEKLLMKKRNSKFSMYIIILAALSSIFFMRGSRLWEDGSVSTSTSPDANLTFSVLGDVHGNSDKLKKVINELYRIRPNLDALVLNGDTVDQGLDKQYEIITSVLNKNKGKLPKTIIKNIGNHELFDYERGPNTPEDVKEFINRYLRFAGEEKTYHSKWIKGYNFISLGTEDGNTPELGAVKAYIYEDQQRWLEERLKEDYKPGRPIFVFLHQHISSILSRWVGVEQKEELINILSKYPEVVVFTSHTHIDLNMDNLRDDQPFSTVHTGAVSYTLKPDGKGGRERLDGIQGLYVEVVGNKVIIKGRDFVKKDWIFSKEIIFGE